MHVYIYNIHFIKLYDKEDSTIKANTMRLKLHYPLSATTLTYLAAFILSGILKKYYIMLNL